MDYILDKSITFLLNFLLLDNFIMVTEENIFVLKKYKLRY